MDTCPRPFLNRIQRSTALLTLLAALLVVPAFAQQLQPIPLPKPQITGGMPLMQALAQRHTTRVFGEGDLSLQTLSNLLWAAFGVNRPREVMRGMGRTAPSAMNSQDIELDVILPTGVYVYDAEQNLLRPILTGDVRTSMLTEAEARAHVTILYVAHAKDRLFPKVERLFAKIVIPSYATERIRGELEDYGIDEATIYPDLEGLGKSVARWLPTDEHAPHEGLYTRLQPSPIDGVGVFAIRKIKKRTLIFSGDLDEIRWVRAEELPKATHLREFYKKFAIVKNGNDDRPKWYGCPRNFHQLTMSWYLNDPKLGDKPNVTCDENYDFWSSRDIKRGEELTVNSESYSDHARHTPGTSTAPQKKNLKGVV
jgi:hypothetical protein